MNLFIISTSYLLICHFTLISIKHLFQIDSNINIFSEILLIKNIHHESKNQHTKHAKHSKSTEFTRFDHRHLLGVNNSSDFSFF